MAVRTKRARTSSVPELTRDEVEAKAERLARSMLNSSREHAFASLARGELDGTMVGVELAMIRDILERDLLQRPDRGRNRSKKRASCS